MTAFIVTAMWVWLPYFSFFFQHPLHTYGCAFIFSTFGFAGIDVVLTLIRTSGALVAVTVTTVRKTITIVLSFILFAKPFTADYLLGASIVFLAIYINIYSKRRDCFDSVLVAFCRRGRLRSPTHSVKEEIL